VPLEFARPEQIIDGLGAMKSGARWSPPGSIRASYCSFNPGTAAEASPLRVATGGDASWCSEARRRRSPARANPRRGYRGGWSKEPSPLRGSERPRKSSLELDSNRTLFYD